MIAARCPVVGVTALLVKESCQPVVAIGRSLAAQSLQCVGGFVDDLLGGHFVLWFTGPGLAPTSPAACGRGACRGHAGVLSRSIRA